MNESFDSPDPRALELAAMCDLIANGTATEVSVTFARPDDSADLAVLADRITAARGLFGDVELAPKTITIHIRRHG